MPTYDDDIDPRDDPRDRDDFDDRGGSRSDRVIGRAKDAIRGPAIGMIIVSILAILTGAFFCYLPNAPNFKEGWDKSVQEKMNDPSMTAAQKKEYKEMMDSMEKPTKQGMMIVGALSMISGGFSFLAAILMLGLRGRALAYMASILSMFPVTNCCCVLGLPFGIWTIVVLGRPEVKAGFATVAQGQR